MVNSDCHESSREGSSYRALFLLDLDMTQEDKDILKKVLCEQLPYGIKVWYPNGTGSIGTVKGIVEYTCYFETNPYYGNSCSIDNIKPYLRPLSSMTEEEKEDFGVPFTSEGLVTLADTVECIDWLNVHHFDYRGLIEKGLALEATEGMYKIE